MKRKLVKQGNNALTVTLPSDWIKGHHLASGDEVDVEVVGKNIVIGSSLKSIEKSGGIDLTDKDPMIKRILGAMYKGGYDQITAKFSSVEEYETAQEVVREEFIGFEIVSVENNVMTIKRVSQLEVEEFESMMRRMFLIIKSMAEDLINSKSNDDILRLIVLRDKDINKIADFCRRIVNKYMTTSSVNLGPLYFITEQLEKVGDFYRDMAKYLRIKDAKLSKTSIKLLKETNLFFNMFYDLYFSFDLGKMAMFGKKRYELKKEIETELEKSTKDNRIISYISSLSESIFDMNGPLMALRL